MSRSADITWKEALEHTDWLKGLAEELVGDPAVASDLARDAFRVLDARRGAAVRDPRAFLRGVLGNLARRHRRAEERRARRERESSRPEALPSAAELAGQLETQRLLLDEVSALGQAARETILLRYFHGLSSAEIARREGLAASTVRKRLERGLEELRGRLDRRFPDRSSWAALVGSLLEVGGGAWTQASSAPLVTGSVIMSTTTKAGLAAALVVAAVWVVVRGFGGAELPPAIDQAGGAAELAELRPGEEEPAPAELTPGVSRPERTALASRPEVAPVADELRLSVREADGTPSANQPAILLDEREELVELRTDDEGLLVLEATGARVGLVFERRAAFPYLLRLDLDAGERVVQLPAGARLSGTVLVDGHAPEEALQLNLHSDHPLLGDPELVRRLARELEVEIRATVETDAGGGFTFEGLPADWSGAIVLPRRYRRVNAEYHLYNPDQLHFERPGVGHRIELKSYPVLTGQVVEPDGLTPVPHAACDFIVSWQDRNSGGFVFQADESGRFELALRERIPRRVVLALARADRTGSTMVELREEDLTRGLELGSLPLTAEREVLFRALDESGVPIAGAIAASGLSSRRSEPTGEDGLGRVTSLPVKKSELWVVARGYSRTVVQVPADPAQRVDAVLRRANVLVVDVRRASGSPFSHARIEIVAPPGLDAGRWNSESSQLRGLLVGSYFYWQGDGEGRAHFGFAADGNGRLEVQGLPAERRFFLRVLDGADAIVHEQELPPLGPAEERRIRVDLTVDLVDLEGRVVDAAGAPLVEVEILIGCGERCTLTLKTDAAGRFGLEDLAGTDVRLEISKVGFLTRFVDSVEQGRELLITLERGQEVQIHLDDPRGGDVEVEGLLVEALTAGGTASWRGRRRRDGVWILSGLPDEPLTLRVHRGERADDFELDPRVSERRVELPR